MPFDTQTYERYRTSTRVGRVVHYRERTGSTMEDARTAVGAAADCCGDAFVAGEQSAGRGRRGRNWVSIPSAGLYVTYYLCPHDRERAPLISIAGGLAAADAVTETSGLSTELKWPNDVLCGGRKIAGVLAEAEGNGEFHVYLGIGINVRAVRGPELPSDVAQVATSIERGGAPAPALELLLAVLSASLERQLERSNDDPRAFLDEWRARLGTLGRRVRLATPSGEVAGEAVDVTDRGELVLKRDDGSTESFAAGDVTTL